MAAIKNDCVENRADMLLVLRAFACFLVIGIHSFTFLPQGEVEKVSWLLRPSGNTGVWVFFTLSGYLMGKAFFTERYALSKEGALFFYRNRILRIVPLYYFSILVSVLFVNSGALVHQPAELIRLLFFVSSRNVLNAPLWSINTEMQFYLLVPFIAYIALRFVNTKGRSLLAGLCISALTVLYVVLRLDSIKDSPDYLKIWWDTVYVPLYSNLALFVNGFLLNNWIKKGPLRMGRKTALALFTGVIALLYGSSAYLSNHVWTWPYSIWKLAVEASTPFLACFLTLILIRLVESLHVNAGSAPRTLKNCLNNPARLLEWLGVLSYGMYIWHRPILDALHVLIPKDLPAGPAAALTFFTVYTAALVFSVVTYHAIEKPAEKFKAFRRSAVEPDR